jgi:ribose/xylose/arabinose/galactoside ABC-type transport system permease subunit
VSEFLRKHRNELGLAVAVLIVVAITAALSDTYHSAAGRTETARIILREAAMLGIFALGAAVVIIAGGIDLSAGSIIAFSGTIFFGMLILLAPDDPDTRWASDPGAPAADR